MRYRQWLVAVGAATLVVSLALGSALARTEAPTGPQAAARPEARAPQYSIVLEVGGARIGGFTEVSGLGIETEVLEYQDGDDPLVRKRPGRTKYSNITLKRGAAQDAPALYEWYRRALSGEDVSQSASLVILDNDGETEVARYDFFECWPTSWQAPEIDSQSRQMVETIELTARGIEKADIKRGHVRRQADPSGRWDSGDYSPSSHFKVEIEGVTQGAFMAIAGLKSEIEIVEYRNGDAKSVTQLGSPHYGSLVLTQDGRGGDQSLYAWYKGIREGATDRRSGSIIYLDREGNELMRYRIEGAFPVGWQGPSCAVGGECLITEKIEIAVEKIERAR